MKQDLIAKQRAARLAKEAEEKRQRIRKALDSGSAKDFWDLVDASAGADACHPWTGYVTTTWTSYPVGKFILDGIETPLVHRIAVFLTYGREVPRGKDVAPLCENHLCCNVRHLMVLPSSKLGGPRAANAVMVEEFFCDAAAAA
jgi:hypothetical protein